LQEANEAYFFHGTRAGVVELIEEHGVDERFGQLDGLFGAGNYFAENASKADQYCTPDDDSNLFPMLLVRVCLGSSVGSTGRDGEADPVVPSLSGRMMQKMGIGNPNKYFRNARSVASKMSKKDEKRQYLHSVIGHGIGAKDGLEFVVYQGIQCYPEFLLYYERVTDDVVDEPTLLAEHIKRSVTSRRDVSTMSEGESLKFQIGYLEQQLDHQREQRTIALEKQKELKEDLLKGEKYLIKLEYRSRKAANKTLCCNSSRPKRSSPSRLQEYLTYEDGDIYEMD